MMTATFSITALLAGCASQIHSARGWNYLSRQDPDRAIKEFRKSEQRPGALIGLSNAYLQKGDFVTAEAYLDDALRRYPNDWSVLLAKGHYYLVIAQDYPAAIQYLERAKQLEQGSAATDIESLILKAKQKMKEAKAGGQPES